MSLQVWLPMNGNTSNQGLGGHTLIGSPTSWSANGKIGKCATFNGDISNIIYNNTSDLNYTDNFSFCMWINHNFTGSTAQYAFTVGRVDYGDGRGYGIQILSTSTIRFWFGTRTEDIVCPANEWHHIAVTIYGTTIKIYKDGILYTTSTTASLPIYSDGNGLGIGCFHFNGGDIYPYYGSINDFRIYSHTLSSKEISEISHGLVCHFPLKSQYETGQVNKYSGDVAEGSLSANQFTKTKLEGERGYNYKLSYTGTGNNMWYAIYADNFSFTPGKKYYYSCKVRCHSRNFNLYLRASRSNNDWVTNSTNVLNPDGKWHEYVVYQTINETYVRVGENVTCNPILEFYTDNLSTSGAVYSADFDIKDVQVIESDCYVPFIDNSMSSNIIGDCSGYGNDGVRNGTIVWNNNSPRYSGSYFFSKSASRYIYRDTRFGFLNNLTFSCWIYQMDRATVHGTGEIGVQFVMSQGRDYRENANLSYGFNIVIVNGYVYIISLNTYANTGYQLDLNKWYHICQTFDGSYIRLYVNGECIYTTADNTTDLWNNDGNAFVIGKMSAGYTSDEYYFPFVGKISDARVYATALSADDIKALYSTSASIDKTGVLSAYEFIEEE